MRKNRTLKAVLSLAMTAVLGLGSAATVLAAPGPTSGANADNVKIVKELQMDPALSIPTGGFTFNFAFTPKEYNGETATSTIVNGAAMPSVGNTSITVNTSDKDTTASTPSLDVYKAESTNKIFDNLATAWTAPGAYTYTVEEIASGYTSAANGETMTDSTTKYEVTAYVKNKAGGGFEIESIGVSKTGAGGGKIDVTPGLTDNEFVFTNVYAKTAGGGGTDPAANASLTVSKTVAVSDHADYSKYFEFTMATTAAGTETASTEYMAYLMDSGAVLDINAPANAANKVSGETYSTGTDATYGSYIKVPAGGTLKVNLKDGQSVAFVGMGVGAQYNATESAATNYKGDIALTVDGASAGTVNGAYSTAVATGTRVIGASTNAAAFTNSFDETALVITPTGITTNDLPFIAMIVLAVGALGAFVVIKSRKRTTGAN